MPRSLVSHLSGILCWYLLLHVYGFALTTSNVLSLQSDRQIMRWNSPGSWVDVLVSSVVLLCLVLITLMGLRRSVFVAFSILVVIVICIVTSLMCLVCATDSTVAVIPRSLGTHSSRIGNPTIRRHLWS